MTEDSTLEALLAEEAGSVLDTFDYAAAWRLGEGLHALATARKLPVAIAISHGGTPVFLSVLPGATSDNIDWLKRKQAVVWRFHHSSLYMRLLCESKSKAFNTSYRLPDAEYAASGGAVPLFVRNVGLVGSAAVSGLPDIDDHKLAMEALSNSQNRIGDSLNSRT